MTFNLTSLVEQLQGYNILSNLSAIQNTPNDKKPRVIAETIIRNLHDKLKTPVPKEIMHDGKVHRITYFDIEPLMKGQWYVISLLLLHVSYGEQAALIEAFYPKDIQLTAKAFAINFTPDTKATNVVIENDKEVIERLDTANVGIAMIMAMLQNLGYKVSHIDQVDKNKSLFENMAKQERERERYQSDMTRAQQANHVRDQSR